MFTITLHRSSRRGSQRASDADRAKVARRLRRAADQGRLHLDEFDERLGLVLSARTYRELDAVVADLPRGRALITGPAGGWAPSRRLRLRLGRRLRLGLGLQHWLRLGLRLQHWLQLRPVRRVGAALLTIRPRRALVAGALATAAVALPVTATNVLSHGSSGSPPMCPHDLPLPDHHCWWDLNQRSEVVLHREFPGSELPSPR